MERPQHISRLTTPAIVLIILFHVMGLTGFLTPYLKPLFLQLVPYHLLLMTIIIIASHRPFNAMFIGFMLVVIFCGYAAEWLGVHKAWLFGHYRYGDTLGFKLGNVPLIIGLNWFLLVYSTGTLMQQIPLKNSVLRVITGALLLVLLDALIEPVAMRNNYWYWAGNNIPVKNYVCWFLLSALLLFAFERFAFKRQSLAGAVLMIAQFLFFAALVFI